MPTLHSQLGEANLFSGNREQAAKEFAAELKSIPRDFNANVRLGWIYREDGRLDEAATLLKKALELRPNDIASLYQMAQLATTKGENAEAVSSARTRHRAQSGIHTGSRTAGAALLQTESHRRRTARARHHSKTPGRTAEESSRMGAQPQSTRPKQLAARLICSERAMNYSDRMICREHSKPTGRSCC